MSGLLWFLLFGLAVGVIARLIVPGPQPGGWTMSIMIGVVGSFVGAFLGRILGIYQPGQAAGWVMSVVGAIALLLVYHAIVSRRSHA